MEDPGKDAGEFMEMYAELCGFLLEVCLRHADIPNKIMVVPRDGKEMYLYYFLPKNSVIDVKNLDITMYFQIIRILEGNIAPKLLQKLLAINKFLSKIPLSTLQEKMSQDEFNSILQVMKQDLEEAGVERNLINLCEKNIFSQS